MSDSDTCSPDVGNAHDRLGGAESCRGGATSGPGRMRVRAVLAAIVLLHGALATTSNLESSATYDEGAHLVAGYSYLHTGDFRLVPEHTPLGEMWCALPLLSMDVEFPSLDQPAWRSSSVGPLGNQFLYELGNDADRLLFAGRLMTTVLSMALCVFVFAVSRRIFGTAGGLLSAGLYALSPTMLAHASLVTTDMAAALFFTLSVVALWWAMNRVSVHSVLVSGLACGGLVLSKFSGLSIVVVALVLAVVLLVSKSPVRVVWRGRVFEYGRTDNRIMVLAAVAIAHVVVFACLTWVVFGLRFEAMSKVEEGQHRLPTLGAVSAYESSWNHELRRLDRLRPIVQAARRNRVLPEAMLYGFVHVLNTTSKRQAFLNGERSMKGFAWYFPYAFLVKTPWPVMAMVVLALVGGLLYRQRRMNECVGVECANSPGEGGASEEQRLGYRVAPLLALIVVYWAFSLTSNLNIGHRHLLPIYPAIFILCGLACELMLRRNFVVRLLPIAVLGWLAVSSLSNMPHHLAYFNGFAGGPKHAYCHLADSSLDWGQDLKRLANLLDERGLLGDVESRSPSDDKVYIAYSGVEPPSYRGIVADDIAFHPHSYGAHLAPIREGLYCVSVASLQQLGLLPSSRWTKSLERLYQGCIDRVRAVQDGSFVDLGDSCALDSELLINLRFARLCAFLRDREPDEWAGRSIFVYELSDEDIEKALFGEPVELAEDDGEALYYLAAALHGQNANELAGELLAQSIKLDDRSEDAHRLLGKIMTVRHKFSLAEHHFIEALRINPDSPETLALWGAALSLQEKHEDAILKYEQALRLDPLDGVSCADLAMSYASMSRVGQALAALDEAISIRPYDPNFRLLRSGLRAQTGAVEAAVADLEVVLDVDPQSPYGHTMIAPLLVNIGRVDDAVVHYNEALRLAPYDVATRAELASLLHRLGRHEEAVGQFQALGRPPAGAQLPPWWSRCLVEHGLSLRSIGFPEEAKVLFIEAVQIDPQWERFLKSQGVTLTYGEENPRE